MFWPATYLYLRKKGSGFMAKHDTDVAHNSFESIREDNRIAV